MPEYRLIEQLGEGGMGVIWKALELPDRREVAVKFLRDDVAQDRDLVKRFRVEVEACVKLSHPNIIRIHDAGVMEGRPYFAMELLHDAKPLDEVLRTQRPMPIPLAVSLMVQLLDALEYCHARNIIHRDLKPPNMMVDAAGHLTLMDFGLVKDHGAATHSLTAAGATVGSPRYMAPEVCRGGDADIPSDMWAVGVIFYEMLWGETPFLGDTLQQTLVAVLREAPRPLSELRPDAGESIDPVIARLLDKNPDTRLSSARRARMMLRSWMEQWHEANRHAPAEPMPPSSTGLRAPVSSPPAPAPEDAPEPRPSPASDPGAETTRATQTLPESPAPRRTTRKVRAVTARLAAVAPPPPTRPAWVVPSALAAVLVATGATAWLLMRENAVVVPVPTRIAATVAPARFPPSRAPEAAAPRMDAGLRPAPTPAPLARRPPPGSSAMLASRLIHAINAFAPRTHAARIVAEVGEVRAGLRGDQDGELALAPLRHRWEQTLADRLAKSSIPALAAAMAPRLHGFYATPSDSDGPDPRPVLYSALTDLRDLEELAAAAGIALEEQAHSLISPAYAPVQAPAVQVPVLLVLALEGGEEFKGELPGTSATAVARDIEPEEVRETRYTTASRALLAPVAAVFTSLRATSDPRDMQFPGPPGAYEHNRALTLPATGSIADRLAPARTEVSTVFEGMLLENGVRVLIAPDRNGEPGPWTLLATLRPQKLERHVVTHSIPPGVVKVEPLHLRIELAWSFALDATTRGAPQSGRVPWVAIAREGGERSEPVRPTGTKQE